MGSDVSSQMRACVERCVKKINKQAVSRARRAANAIRNAELNVLKGQRSGKVYKKPDTYGEKMSRATKKLMGDYGHKLKGGQLYRASAPGEPPAKMNGVLRTSFVPYVEGVIDNGGVAVRAGIKSDLKYAPMLEEGSARVAPRPYREPILEKAKPEIERIFNEPYKL